MRENVEFYAMRRVYRLMLLDVWGLIGFVALMVVQSVVLLHPFGRAPEATIALMRVDRYVAWTLKALQLLAWALMVGALTRLADRAAGFASARLWYLFRIIAFAVFTVTAALIPRGRGLEAPVWEKLRFLPELVVVAMEVFMEVLAVALASWRILQGGNVMLDSFGMTEAVDENARTGRRFLVSAGAASVACCALALVLNVGQNSFGFDLRRGLLQQQEPRLLFVALGLLVVLTAVAGVVCVSDWICSARHFKKTYQALEELSR